MGTSRTKSLSDRVVYARQRALAIEQKVHAVGLAKGLNAGELEGYGKGHIEGYNAGLALGEATIERKLAVELRILMPRIETTAIVSDEEYRSLILNLYEPRPNIYRGHDGWVVRILENLQTHHVRHFKSNFPTFQTLQAASQGVNDRSELIRPLLAAIGYRDRFANNTHEYQALWQECVTHVCENNCLNSHRSVNDVTQTAAFQCALEFHKRLKFAGVTNLYASGMVGADPEDLLNIRATAMLNRGWSCLFTNLHQRVHDAFRYLGLGIANKTSADSPYPERTVRDLLLITPDEILDVPNFGRVSLQRLREGLADHGLALFGDRPPAAPRPENLDPGSREFRAIDLGL